jgi:hypothetical protein
MKSRARRKEVVEVVAPALSFGFCVAFSPPRAKRLLFWSTMTLRPRHQKTTGASIQDRRDGLQGFDQFESSSSSTSNIFPDPETSEHRQSTIKNNPLAGITFPRLVKLLWTKHASIDFFRYKARIATLLCVSMFHSVLELVESIYIFCCLRPIFKHVEAEASEDRPPLFVLGHPRTGTTLLHSLLSLDTDRFAHCSTFCAGFPHAFLSFEPLGKMAWTNYILS